MAISRLVLFAAFSRLIFTILFASISLPESLINLCSGAMVFDYQRTGQIIPNTRQYVNNMFLIKNSGFIPELWLAEESSARNVFRIFRELVAGYLAAYNPLFQNY